MPKFFSHGAKGIGGMPFLDICMERVEMNPHIWLAHIADQLSRIAQCVEEIRLETIERLNTKSNSELSGVLPGHLQTFYSPFPFVFRSATSGHHTQPGVEWTADEFGSEFRRSCNARGKTLQVVRSRPISSSILLTEGIAEGSLGDKKNSTPSNPHSRIRENSGECRSLM